MGVSQKKQNDIKGSEGLETYSEFEVVVLVQLLEKIPWSSLYS